MAEQVSRIPLLYLTDYQSIAEKNIPRLGSNFETRLLINPTQTSGGLLVDEQGEINPDQFKVALVQFMLDVPKGVAFARFLSRRGVPTILAASRTPDLRLMHEEFQIVNVPYQPSSFPSLARNLRRAASR